MRRVQSILSPRSRTILARIREAGARLTEPDASIQDPGTRRQVQLLSAFLLALLTVIALGGIGGVIARGLEISSAIQLVLLALLAATYWLSRTSRHELAAVLAVIILAITTYGSILASPARASEIIYAYLPIAFIAAGFLLSTRAEAVFVSVNVIIVFSLPLFIPGYTVREAGTDGGILLSIGAIIIIFGVVRNRAERDRLAVLNQANDELRSLRSSLEERVNQRTALLQASAEVGQAAAAILDQSQLLREVVNLITARFGFYYAAVFTLNDAGTAAVLREASGEAGRLLKERAHQLALNEKSMVGYAITQRESRIALDVGTDPVRFANPLLPETRSEIALPLIAGNRVLGALDVQSVQAAAFDEANAAVLQSLANQIAVALNNAEQFKQTGQQARLQASLNQFSHSLFATSKIEDLYQVLATALNGIVPHDYLSLTFAQSGSAILHEYALQADVDSMLAEGPLWSIPNTLCGRACTTRQPIVSTLLAQDVVLDDAAHLEQAGFQSALVLPLVVGERVLGTLNFASRKTAAFSLSDSAHLEQLAGQVAVALENHRLAQAQQTSLREMEVLTRELTGQAWARRRQRQAVESVQYVRSGIEADLPASTLEIEAAMEQGAPIVRSGPDGPDNPSPYQAALAVPIVLRGEVLGALQVGEARQAREWTTEDLTFMQAVANQVALALDNARLIEETGQRAERERLVADISSRMFAANDLETIVRIAGEELGHILQVKSTTVQVGMEALQGDGSSGRQEAQA
jgi:GAF domain-containing protein